jgi:peptidyl-prolyl cis-trans isomerase A (cyclophilin A)
MGLSKVFTTKHFKTIAMHLNIVLKKSVYLFALALVTIACKDTKKTKTLKENIPTKKVVTVSKKKKEKFRYIKDTINSENAIAFFTDYGKKHPETKVQLSTRFGDVHIKLYKNTPLHRASFIYLVKNNYFNTTCFYRIVPDFIVQGGNSDEETTAEFRRQLNNYLLPSEFRKNRKHKRGALAAAREWVDNPMKKSSPFQFYFIQAQRSQAHLDFEHTVFGEITKGLSVIDTIAKLPTDPKEWPLQDVFIKMEVLE